MPREMVSILADQDCDVVEFLSPRDVRVEKRDGILSEWRLRSDW
jgi:hypothetical protein